jgi:hypothetical protein
MLPPAADARVQRELERLLGLELSGTHRGADLRVLKFGPLRPAGRGTVGDLALHVQCPWRIDGSDGVVTGRGDLWEQRI